jgi:hypothetical protein
MAIDQLWDGSWKFKFIRVYRHDLEGFVWILAWVFFQYQDRQYTPHRIIKNWQSGGYHMVHSFKIDFYRGRFAQVEAYSKRVLARTMAAGALHDVHSEKTTCIHLFHQDLAFDLDPDNDEPFLELWI